MTNNIASITPDNENNSLKNMNEDSKYFTLDIVE